MDDAPAVELERPVGLGVGDGESVTAYHGGGGNAAAAAATQSRTPTTKMIMNPSTTHPSSPGGE